jgi:hypothetical protein
VPGSFIDFPFLSSQVLKIFGIKLHSLMRLLEIINIVALIVLIVFFLSSFFNKEKLRNINSFKWLMLLGGVASCFIFLTLGWLSFTFQVQRGYETEWNYIYEARYYALVILILQFAFGGWCFLFSTWKKSAWQKIILSICAALLFIEISHSIYFHIKVASDFSKHKEAIYREQDYNYFNQLVADLQKQNPGFEILVASPTDNFYTYAASYFGNKGLFDPINLKQNLPKVKTNSFLIVMLYNNELGDYENFISNTDVKKINRIAFSNFFLVKLIP